MTKTKIRAFEFLGEFTDQNTYFNAERTNKFAGHQIKKQETNRVAFDLLSNGVVKKIETPARFVFHWITKDLRKDPDNIAFSCKFILDGFVKAGLLPNDGRKQILSISHSFGVDAKNPRVKVTIISGNTLLTTYL